jgi:molybdopterin/thiamine biosynthesis adenylyltransferase
VTEADLGVNFFLEDESLGKFRAEETVRLLEELNPDVKGTALKEVSKRLHTCLFGFKTSADTSAAFGDFPRKG